MSVEIENSTPLEGMKQVIRQYHLVLDQGGYDKIAQSVAVEEIEQILHMTWLPGYEFERRMMSMRFPERTTMPNQLVK